MKKKNEDRVKCSKRGGQRGKKEEVKEKARGKIAKREKMLKKKRKEKGERKNSPFIK